MTRQPTPPSPIVVLGDVMVGVVARLEAAIGAAGRRRAGGGSCRRCRLAADAVGARTGVEAGDLAELVSGFCFDSVDER